MNLKARLKALEAATPGADTFSIEIHGEPTTADWLLINEAHQAGSLVFIFEMAANTLGVWMPGSEGINWSADNG